MHEHLHAHIRDEVPGRIGRGMRSRRGPNSVEARAAFGGFPGPFGPGWGGPRGRRGRGPGGRARRGDVRAAVLALLTERPMHGYEIIQELAERTSGVWKPSPGSVYPTLQLLEDEGYVVAEEDGGKRRFSLTESGRSAAAEMAGNKTPWEEVNDDVDPGARDLREGVGQLAIAAMQIARVGTAAQQAEAATALGETRRRLYAILAAED